MKELKVALVVGHNSASKGAYSKHLGKTEYDYFSDVAEYVKGKNSNVDVIYRVNQGNNYPKEMNGVLNKISPSKYDLVLELHYNANKDLYANGAETLYSKRFVNAKKIADAITLEHNKALGLRVRSSVLRVSNTQNGAYPMLKSIVPYFLVESFFGSNEKDCEKVKDYKLVGNVILNSIKSVAFIMETSGEDFKQVVANNTSREITDPELIKKINLYLDKKFHGVDSDCKKKLFEALKTGYASNVIGCSMSVAFKNPKFMVSVNDNHLFILSKANKNKPDVVLEILEKIYETFDYNYQSYTIGELNKVSLEFSGSSSIISTIKKMKSYLQGKMNINQDNGIVEEVAVKKEVVTDEYVNKKKEELEIKKNSLNIEAYSIQERIVVLKKLLEFFINYTEKNIENEIASTFYKKFTELCNKTSNLKLNQETNCNELKTMVEPFEFGTGNSEKFIELSTEVNLFVETYKLGITNEFIKSNLLLTGTIENIKIDKINLNKINNDFISGFFHNNNYEKAEESKPTNPISEVFKKSDFLYMKKLDYDNLKAYLNRTPIKPTKRSCDVSFILIYTLLLLSSMKHKNFKETSIEREGDSIMDKVARHFNAMKSNEWKHEYSDVEKFFSMLFPFVEYRNNPFDNIMKDEGFRKSQESSKKMRADVEAEAAKVLEGVKKVFYESYDGQANYGIYSIFQGLADLAYELSSPMTFKIDDYSTDLMENIIQTFMSACVSSIEMQTTLLIYDFIFNFGINIGGKYYTLNDINNILKTLNLVIDVSRSDIGTDKFYRTRMNMVESSAYFQTYEKFGFLAYDKRYSLFFAEDINDMKLTGYYLSDEKVGFDEMEYLRRKGEECHPGEVPELRRRISKLDYYEKLSMFANQLIKDGKIRDIACETNITLGNGWLNIRNFYEGFKAEANNDNPEIINMPMFLYDLLNDVAVDDEPYKEFVRELNNSFGRYFTNMNTNKKKLKEFIADKMSEEKIIDWSMKMIPSYELIAKAFGFDSTKKLGTLDSFIDTLMQFMNTIIGITFDKWKVASVESSKVRRLQLIEKERYYYLQSIPMLLDWVFLSLEKNVTGCFKTRPKIDSLDKDAFEDNEKMLEHLEEEILMKLKAELGVMSTLQLNIVRKKIEESILGLGGFSNEFAKDFSAKLTNLKELAKNIFSDLDEEDREKIVKTFSENLD